MANIGSINNVLWANVASVNNVLRANIGSIGGLLGGSDGIDTFTRLMLHMDGVHNGTAFPDSSTQDHAITSINALTKTNIKQFGSASGYFDGSGDRLTIPDSIDWDLGTGDFTIEFWFRAYAITDWDIALHCGSGTANAESNWHVSFNDSDNLRFTLFQTDTPVSVVNDADVVTDNDWHHYAAIRSGNNLYLAIDGTLSDAVDITGMDVRYLASSIVTVGSNWGGTQDPEIYIDELRISKSVARWTENFSVPTGPYGTPNGNDANVMLLSHMDGSDDGTLFIDDGPYGLTMTAAVNAVTSIDDKYFGSASGYFDGSSYVTVPDSSNWTFGLKDFTIDCWIKTSVKGGIIISQWEQTGNHRVWELHLDASGFLKFTYSGDGSNTGSNVGTTDMSDGAWHHIAVVGIGATSQTLYVDGVAEGTPGSFTGEFVDRNSALLIGAEKPSAPAAFFTGYIDEVRVSKEIARWTTNFTPPTVPYS